MNITKLINDICLGKKIYLYLSALLIIGISLMVTSNNKNIIFKETYTNINNDNTHSANDSYSDFEQKLCNTLSKIDGVGEVEIFINYNMETTDKNNKAKSVFGVNDISNDEPRYNNIEGVVIVAQGGGNAEIINLLRNTVSNVLGIALHKVDVLKMR